MNTDTICVPKKVITRSAILAFVSSVSPKLNVRASFALSRSKSTGLWLVLQSLAAVALVVSGTLAIVALWPRSYDTEAAEEFETWATQLREFYRNEPDADLKVSAAFTQGEIRRAKERIAKNGQHNALKSNLIEWSFWGSSAAFVLNLVTVVELTIQRLS